MTRATAKDVARAVGVSVTTVSNAYWHPGRLGAALRTRILGVAERLGYTADPTARGLRLRTTGAVGVLYSDALPFAFSDRAFSEFLRGVTETLEAEGRTLTLLSGGAPQAAGGDALRSAAVDGVIWYGPARGDPRLRELPARALPLVVVDGDAPAGVPAVALDDEAGAAAAADHLLGLGHRRLAVLAIGDGALTPARVEPESLCRSPFRVIRARALGYAAAARRHGVTFSRLPAWLVPSRFELARMVGRELLRDSTRPTAALCMSDELALGVLAAARDVGVEVPEALSVVGFDDVAESGRSVPPLSTVAQDHARKGRTAAQALLEVLSGGAVPRASRLTASLVIRGSTAPPRRARPTQRT